MYETLTTMLIVILVLVVYMQGKRIDTLRDSYTEFITQYALYIKAVGDHSEAVQGALERLDNKIDMAYHAEQSLYAHVVYLDKQLIEVKEFVEYQDKRLIGMEQDVC